MEPCPFCEQPLIPDAAGKCSSCGTVLAPPPEKPYGEPTKALRRALLELKGRHIGLPQVNQIFSQVTGSVQQVLDQVAEDLEENFINLSKAAQDIPEGDRTSNKEFFEDFQELQDEIHEILVELGRVFERSSTVEDLKREEGILDNYLAKLESSVEGLGILKSETDLVETTLLAHEEDVPDQVGQALECYESAMDALVRYIETSRDANDLSECVRHSDQARVLLNQVILAESMRGQ